MANEKKVGMAEKHVVIIETQDDGTYVAYNDTLEGTCIGTGETIEEAKKDYFNTLNEISEMYTEEGRETPDFCKIKPVFKFDLKTFFEHYSSINIAGFAKFVGINATLLRQYKRGNTYISEKQLQKIEDGVHCLGNELLALKLV